MGCGSHNRFKLDIMPVVQPPVAGFWRASTALDLARGAAVAESVNMTTTVKEQFFMSTSTAVVELRLAEPTDDQIVTAMLKMIDNCPERRQAFVADSRVPLKCDTTVNPEKSARKIRVAELVRASLDGKTLRSEETIVVGGTSASRFAEALGLRSFLTSHFAATVKRVFIWMDLPDDNVVAEVFIDNIVTDVSSAAAWTHVVFVVMPPPYDDQRLNAFETFMRHFNGAALKLPNVLWLDESACWNGYRFAYALGSNELVTDHSSIYLDGTISSKGAAAAIKFLSHYCNWLVIAKPEVVAQPSSSYTDPGLHATRVGKITKYPARDAPSRGGGGRGRGYTHNNGRGYQSNYGRGHQQNYGRGRGNQSNFGRHRGFN
ncbi:hypothetical protein AAVH_21986 [Aphelenchoides avenae]|nr:hypothetical protein AAVH_21986 [Aphelenchus avenae]